MSLKMKFTVLFATGVVFLSTLTANSVAAEVPGIFSMSPGAAALTGLYPRNDRQENLLLNPAATSDIRRREFTFGTGLHTGFNNWFFGYAHPTEMGALSARASYLTDRSEDNTYLFTAALGYGLPIYQDLNQTGSAGLSLKTVGEKHSGEDKLLFLSDAGFIHSIYGDWDIGIAFKNIGNSRGVGERLTHSPMTFQVLLRRELHDVYLSLDDALTEINFAVAAESRHRSSSLLKLGLESRFRNTYIRTGCKVDMGGDNWLGVGIGTRYRDIAINYTVLMANEITPSHFISTDFRFGEVLEPERLQEPEIERFYRLGMNEYYQGNLARAQEYFHKVEQIRYDHRETREYLEEISRAIALVRQRQPKEDEVTGISELLERAERLFEDGNYGSALQHYSAVLMVDRENEKAQSRISEINQILAEQEERERELARQRRRAAIVRQLEDYYSRGQNSYGRGNFSAALETYEEGITYARRNNMPAWVRRFETASQEAREKIAEEHFLQGHQYYQRNLFTEALREFEKAVEYDPDKDAAKRRITEIRSRMRREDEQEAEKLYNQGLEAYSAGDYSAAAEYWTEALELNPDLIEAQKALERLRARDR